MTKTHIKTTHLAHLVQGFGGMKHIAMLMGYTQYSTQCISGLTYRDKQDMVIFTPRYNTEQGWAN